MDEPVLEPDGVRHGFRGSCAGLTGAGLHFRQTQYDLLGRPVNISYSDGTAQKSYAYDVSGGWAQPLTNTKGRLSNFSSPIAGNLAATIFSYDQMGRIIQLGECQPSGCWNGSRNVYVSYSYDLAGNLTSAGNGIWGSTGYQYTTAGEVKLVTNIANDSTHPANLASSFTQGPNGPTAFQYGNSLYRSNVYDPIGRAAWGVVCSNNSALCQSGTLLTGWAMTPQGSQVVRACDSALGPCANIGYDDLNRMSSRTPDSGTALSNTWSYDRYGNRLTQTSGQGYNVTASFNTANNQDSNYTYDGVGNVTYDPGSGNSYKFDAEGNVIEVDRGSIVVANYYYDALNQRVRSVVNGTAYEYVFDQWGRRSAMLNGSTGAAIEANLYWPNGGPPLAFDLNGATHFEHQDWVGTERLRTSYNGSVEGAYTSQPFGDAQTTTQGSDQDAYHYAELDHDSESDLDHAQARHYNSSHGHWMSPDPYSGSYHWRNPQSFNRYAYALNRPLSERNGRTLLHRGRLCYPGLWRRGQWWRWGSSLPRIRGMLSGKWNANRRRRPR